MTEKMRDVMTKGVLHSETGNDEPLFGHAERFSRHFSNEHLLNDLKSRSARGGAVTLAAQGVKLVLQLGTTMVLARLLTPGDFGLIAMVTAITGFVAMFKDAGLSNATIQRKEITHGQVSTLFWINVGLSFLVASITAMLSPLIAHFYREPRLALITQVLATTLIFGGFTVQHQALMRRQMRFQALAIVEIAAMSISVFIAVLMAVYGFGYWSLVGMSASASAANALLVWWLCDWVPGLPKWRSGVSEMLRFGGGLTGFSFLNYFVRNADNVIVGYALGSGPLGVYSKAYSLLMLPIKQINAPVSNVMVPALSRLQDDPVRYRRAFLQATSAISLASMPIVMAAVVLADEAVSILLGPGWEMVAVVFRCLAPAAFFGTLNVAPGWLCISRGRVKTQLLWASLTAPFTVVAFMIGAKFGIVGVAIAFSATWCVGLYIFIAMACCGSPVRQRDIAISILPQVFSSAMAAAAGLAIKFLVAGIVSNIFLQSVLVLLVIAITYMLLVSLFPATRTQMQGLLRNETVSMLFPRSKHCGRTKP